MINLLLNRSIGFYNKSHVLYNYHDIFNITPIKLTYIGFYKIQKKKKNLFSVTSELLIYNATHAG